MIGPGSYMSQFLADLSLKATDDCNCLELAELMDDYGYRKVMHFRDLIIAKMKKNAKEYGWSTRFLTGIKMVQRGIVLNPVDPIPGLFDHIMNKYLEEHSREMVLRNHHSPKSNDRRDTSENSELSGWSGL